MTTSYPVIWPLSEERMAEITRNIHNAIHGIVSVSPIAEPDVEIVDAPVLHYA